jgi:hypothetical protein
MWRVERNPLGIPRLVSPYVDDHRKITMPSDGVVTSATGVYYWPAFKTADEFAEWLPSLRAAMQPAFTFGVTDGWVQRDDHPLEGPYGSLRAEQFTSCIILAGDEVAPAYPTLTLAPLSMDSMRTVEELARETL